MRYRYDILRPFGRGFTLIELLVTITIISILASLTLAGLAVARQRVKADRTEMTIRKIHEVIMPHYERFLTLTPRAPTYSHSNGTLQSLGNKGVKLISKRRLMSRELPDGWKDLRAPEPADTPNWGGGSYDSGISRRLMSMAPVFGSAEMNTIASQFSDAECLWLSVIRGGYADPAIVGHFRENEFGDKDADGQREFIDGWGNAIHFLRWAPAFVSRYQPLPITAESADTRSHDAFDKAGIDPIAKITLYPLIFSGGPDGEPNIQYRENESGGDFTYPGVAYDPYFIARQPPGVHLRFGISAGTIELGRYPSGGAQYASVAFGANVSTAPSDDIHNHAMSR